MAPVLDHLREVKSSLAALVTAVALALAVTGTACGGDDNSATDGSAGVDANPAEEKINAQKALERQEAYNTAFKQCKRIGAQALRTNYGSQGPLDLLAQIYVSQSAAYFKPYEQEAIRGCTVGLSR
jgi:hypothetical protein